MNNKKSNQKLRNLILITFSADEWVSEWAPCEQHGCGRQSRRRVVVACSDYRFETSCIVSRDGNGRHDRRRDRCNVCCNWHRVSCRWSTSLLMPSSPLSMLLDWMTMRIWIDEDLLKMATSYHIKVTWLVHLKIAMCLKNRFRAIATGRNQLRPVKTNDYIISKMASVRARNYSNCYAYLLHQYWTAKY